MSVNNSGANPPQRDLAEATRELAERLIQQDDQLEKLNESLNAVTSEFNELKFLMGQHERQQAAQLFDPSAMHGPTLPGVFASAQESGAAYNRMQMLERSMVQYHQQAAQRIAELETEARRAIAVNNPGPVYNPAPTPAGWEQQAPSLSGKELEKHLDALARARAEGERQAAREAARAAAEAKREQAQQERDAQKVQREHDRGEAAAAKYLARDDRQQAREAAAQQAANVALAERAHAEQMTYLPTVGSRQHYARAYAEQQANQLRLTAADVQRARIQADYAQSPQGQEGYRQQLDMQRQIDEHRAREERSKQIAEMGRFRFALSEARDRLVTFGSATLKVGGGLMAMAGMASPNSAATMAGSMQLLMMQAGRPFVPLMEKASGYMQDFYKFNKEFAQSTGYSPASGLAAAAAGYHFGGWRGAATAAAATLAMSEGEGPGAAIQRIGGQALTGAGLGSMTPFGPLGTAAGAGIGLITGGITELFRGSESPEEEKARLRKELLRSYAGMPRGGQYSSYEGYMMESQAAVLSQSPLDRQIFQDQLEIMERILNRLEQLGDKDAPRPAWR